MHTGNCIGWSRRPLDLAAGRDSVQEPTEDADIFDPREREQDMWLSWSWTYEGSEAGMAHRTCPDLGLGTKKQQQEERYIVKPLAQTDQ